MKQRTCDKCLLLDGCEIGARYKPACKVYIDDPFKLAAHEARWSFRVKAKAVRAKPKSSNAAGERIGGQEKTHE